MAAYGTLVAWARAMGHDEAAGLLEQILDEEKAADEKLTTLAEGGINQEAAQLAHGNGNGAGGDEDDDLPARDGPANTAEERRGGRTERPPHAEAPRPRKRKRAAARADVENWSCAPTYPQNG